MHARVAPILGLSLVVGLIVSTFQAMTQINEATLTFVPKVLAVFAATLPISPVDVGRLDCVYDSHHHQYSDADSLRQGHHMNAVQTLHLAPALSFRPFHSAGADRRHHQRVSHSEHPDNSHASEAGLV